MWSIKLNKKFDQLRSLTWKYNKYVKKKKKKKNYKDVNEILVIMIYYLFKKDINFGVDIVEEIKNFGWSSYFPLLQLLLI